MVTMVKADCCIVIPIYQDFDQLPGTALQSLTRASKILKAYPFFLVVPQSLQLEKYLQFFNDWGITIQLVLFDDSYFASIQGYNQLLLSPNFYRGFTQYQYMLLYQTDAWIFEDGIAYWCKQGYHYIGAPFVEWEWSTFYARHLTLPRRILYWLGYRQFNLVGNGGLSLRHIKACLHNLNRFKKAAQQFTHNEDYFFSYYINSFNPFFRVAPFRKALQFSFDENPATSFALNGQKLPMGCHAWPKYKDFWKDYIPFEHIL